MASTTTTASIPDAANNNQSTASTTSSTTTEQRKGNLHSLLKAFDQSQTHNNSNNNNNNNNDNASIGINMNDNPNSDSLSIQFENVGRERSSTLGSLRERGLTFGSEFDLGLGLTNDNVAHDAVFDLSAVNGHPNRGGVGGGGVGGGGDHNGGTSGRTSGANSTAGDGGVSVTVGVGGTLTGEQQQSAPQDITLSQSQEMQETSSQTSGHGFLSKMFNNQSEGQQQQQTGGMREHTPPTSVATSYEVKHFGKRLRSGSLSGRLRSMSDLEDKGIIDSNQKGILKDLIISGDNELMVAVEKYEKGDTKALESMIKNRTRKASDIDILGDLDLDFLSMNEDMAGDNSLASGRRNSRSLPISIRTRRRTMSEFSAFMQNSNDDVDTKNLRGSPPATIHGDRNYDDIGELDFNADFTSGGGNNDNEEARRPGVKTRSNSIMDLQRNRANSLAFGALLEDSNGNDELDSVGKWMDRAPAMQERKMPLKKRVSSQIVGANGSLYIINNGATPKKISKKEEKMTAAELKRREREEKKAMKEREKLEKKLQKQREKQERKERDAREKKSGRKRKGESPKKKKPEVEEEAENDEPKVIVSGTGRPRSLSDPNLSIKLDENGLMQIDHPPDWVGAYSPESRKIRIERFLAKRNHRVWVKKVKYDVRKNFADSRLRVKGRFVKKEDELLMRDMMSLT